MIAVFAYAFPHRKTYDFLVELFFAGERNVTVFAAPFKKLDNNEAAPLLRSAANLARPIDTSLVCNQLGYQFIEIAHDDVLEISKQVKSQKLSLGIVSGARILKPNIIQCFQEGIVNFHLGKIPETSGLDCFFYTLKNNVEAGVTTHFIDAKGDAGDFLAFNPVPIGIDDTPEDVQFNCYTQQINALRIFLKNWRNGSLNPTTIHREMKNSPMTRDQKWETLKSFPQWRVNRINEQLGESVILGCEKGDTESVLAQISRFPNMLEFRTANGWTPLIVASFNQQSALVDGLLKLGANPNAAGDKGTTVLMYAKTALVNQPTPDFKILKALISAGADTMRCDKYGKNVMHYVSENSALKTFFETAKA